MKRTQGIESEIIAHEGNEVTLRLYNQIDVEEAKQKAVDGRYLTYLDFYEKDKISDLQRKHYFALVGDFTEYTGTPESSADSYLKYQFMQEHGLDEFPSLARGQMKKSTATELITYVIEFMIGNEIPFRKQQFYLTADVNRMLYAMTMKRLCFVCGKPHADLHHATDLVGMGQDRNKYNHLKSTFMTLCRTHHNEVHNLGLSAFASKYHIKPIKLDEKSLKELGIRGDYQDPTDER